MAEQSASLSAYFEEKQLTSAYQAVNTNIHYENNFWLRIMRDHLSFIRDKLGSNEVELLLETKNLIPIANTLLKRAKDVRDTNISVSSLVGFDASFNAILPFLERLAKLKKTILARQLEGKINFSLPTAFVNETLDELEEYKIILEEYTYYGEVPRPDILRLHKLWLSNMNYHLGLIKSNLDPIEKMLATSVKQVEKSAVHLFERTIETIKYLRSGLTRFPEIDKLNSAAEAETLSYLVLLGKIAEMMESKTVLTTLDALTIDHMMREERYYLFKLGAKIDPELAIRSSISYYDE